MSFSHSGSTIGNYLVGDLLGKGGYSHVYLGRNTATNEAYALKFLDKDSIVTSNISKQVEREITAMSKLDHKNVLKMVEINWEVEVIMHNKVKKIIMIVLELASGRELFDFLSYTGCFEESIARSYFNQLISGLECCHNAGFAHRDLKPENILLSSDFVLKIADFGFATSLDNNSLLRTECGTRSYMAPEILKGQRYNGQAVDIFSAGVILFICLAGFPPFQAAVNTDWWFHKLSTNQHSLFWEAHCRTAFFSSTAKDLLNKMLTPDPEVRISLEGIKSHPWFQGPILQSSSLSNEMKRRKAHIDSEKKKEKLASMAKNAGAAGFVDRHIESDTPIYPPKLLSTHVVNEYNSFKTLVDPLQILGSMETLLSSMRHGIQVRVKESDFQIFAELGSEFGNLALSAQVYEDDGAYLIEINKDKGDKIIFRKVFDMIQHELTNSEAPRQSGVTQEELHQFIQSQESTEVYY